MNSTVLIEATICVPDIGTFRYAGRIREQHLGTVRSALENVTLDGSRRERPYDVGNGIRMYGDDPDGRRADTFGTLDYCTFAAAMVLLTGGTSKSCERYLKEHNEDESVDVCAAFDEYAGVYVLEWTSGAAGSGVPDSERPFLDNSDP